METQLGFDWGKGQGTGRRRVIVATIRPGPTIEEWIRARRLTAIAVDPLNKLRMAKARARARRL